MFFYQKSQMSEGNGAAMACVPSCTSPTLYFSCCYHCTCT